MHSTANLVCSITSNFCRRGGFHVQGRSPTYGTFCCPATLWEGGGRRVLQPSPPEISHAAGQFSVSDGAGKSDCGRFGAGSFSAGVSSAQAVFSEREIHDVDVPHRDEPGAQFGAG